MIPWRVSLPISFFLIISCTFRNNPYDPASPYYKSPILTIDVRYDSTTISMATIDQISITALAPLKLKLTATAQDYFKTNEKLDIHIEYTHKNTTLADNFSAIDSVLVFKTVGLHHLKLSAISEYGATTQHDIAVVIDTLPIPRITGQTLSRNILPLFPPNEHRPTSTCIVTIDDPNRLVDSVIYSSPFLNRIIHELPKGDPGSYTDSAVLSLDIPSDSTKDFNAPIFVLLYDALGRCDTVVDSIMLSTKITNGSPPAIDSVFILNRPAELVDYQPVYFDIVAKDFIDFDEYGIHPIDSVNMVKEQSDLTYYWSFGDNSNSWQKQPIHIYTTPGIYRINVMVTDEVFNAVFDSSLTITVLPRSQHGPRFTNFLVTYKPTNEGCTVFLSAAATSDSSKIQKLMFIFDDTIPPLVLEKSEVNYHPYYLTVPKIYRLYCIAYDDKGFSCDTSFTLSVTKPD